MPPRIADQLVTLLVARLDTAATGSSAVDWATEALDLGLDTPALVWLAGLPRDSTRAESDPLLDRALTELRLVPPEAPVLRRCYVSAVCRQILEGELPVSDALARIHAGAVSPLGHPPDLKDWCFLWEGLDPQDYRSLSAVETELRVRRLAASWAARDSWPPALP